MNVEKITIGNAHIYVSEVVSSEHYAIEKLNGGFRLSIDRILAYKSKNRRLEMLTVLLMHGHLYPSCEMLYNENGAPYLENINISVSVSHSKDYVAIAYCEDKLGVDIEKVSHRVVPVAQKFCTPRELALYNTELLLTRVWTAKEALYKYFEKDIVDFSKDIELTGCSSAKNNSFSGLVHFHDNVYPMVLESTIIKDNVLTIAKRKNI